MTIDDMIEGKYGLNILPDIESMNAMLEVRAQLWPYLFIPEEAAV